MKLIAAIVGGGAALLILGILLIILTLIGMVGWAIGSALFGPVGGFLTGTILIIFFLGLLSEAVS